MAKMTTCLWFDHGKAREAAEFYASTSPDSHVRSGQDSPADNPSTKRGEEIAVEFTVLGQSFVGLNGRSRFSPNEAVSFRSSPTLRKKPTATGTRSSAMAVQKACAVGARIDGGFLGRLCPATLMAGMADPDPIAAKRVMEAMMKMRKIDIAKIEAVRAGEMPNA
jgi:predicted 3-demethylubiquinone-9 3-methyltransferase (glyoxalase superfamily)